MTNKELFLKRINEYFKENSDIFIEKMNEPLTHGFFINTKKADKDEILNEIDFEYETYNETSFRHQNLSIGKTKAHELGLIYSQGLEASLPALLPDTSDVKIVLDMCAAPGGKSINIYNRLNNDAILISNEHDFSRVKALNSNIERMGYENVIISAKETKDLAKSLNNAVDLVILDAPCSGEGMIRKYPEIIDDYSLSNIETLAKLQSELLDDAYECLKGGGQLVYSTCTYSSEEDELQVESFLNRHQDMHLVYEPKKLSIIDDTEGQFMALFIKDGNESKTIKELKTVKNNIVEKFIKENIDINNYYLYKINNRFYISLIPLYDLKDRVVRYGLELGEVINDRFEPSHCLYRSNRLVFKHIYELNDDEYDKYITGNEIACDKENSYIQVKYHGYPLGFGKVSNKRLKNKYPKGLRRVL